MQELLEKEKIKKKQYVIGLHAFVVWKTSGILDIRGCIMYNIEIVKIKLFIRIFKAEFSKQICSKKGRKGVRKEV